MVVLKIFVDSLKLLREEPKLFFPKIFVAFFYGGLMILSINFGVSVLQEIMQGNLANQAVFLWYNIALFILLIIAYFCDIFTNAMYPSMVHDFFKKGKVSLKKSAKSIVWKMPGIFFSIIIIELVLAIPFAIISSFFIVTKNFTSLFLFIIILLIAYLVLSAVFYFAYPLLVLDSVFFLKMMEKSWFLSREKMNKMLLFSLLPFCISLLSFALAFFANQLGFLLVFFALRFLIALIQTYHMVVNPTAFLRYREI